MTTIEDRDLYQILIAEFRYAVRRDNHLAPSTCAQHIKEYLPKMSQEWRAAFAKQLSEEIIAERTLSSSFFDYTFKFKSYAGNKLDGQLSQDYLWEELLVFLVDYLEMLPANTDQYMHKIYGRMEYTNGINYYSKEIHNKITNNINKK